MADQPTAAPAKSGWVKAILFSLAGIVSGGFVTYLTPLVDRIVKPGKPLANFAVEHQGLTVTFQNRSAGNAEGWWDFGDGSALEPVSTQQTSVTHAYPHAGAFTAKLSLRNYIGEESDRTVSIQLDEPPPGDLAVVAFKAEAMSPQAYAPATFRVSAQVKNADLYCLDFGEGYPLQVVTDLVNAPEQMITLKWPGRHILRVLAVKGKKTVEQSQIVTVNPPPKGMVCAMLVVTDKATQVDKQEIVETLNPRFPTNHVGDVFQFAKVIRARPGYLITDDAKVTVLKDQARDLKIEIAPDRLSAKVTGALDRPTGLLARRGPLPNLVAKVSLVEVRQAAVAGAPVQICQQLGVPGSILIPLPKVQANWSKVQRSLQLQLQQDSQVLWQGTSMPQGAPINLSNQPCKVSATVLGDQLRIDITRVPRGLSPVSN